jgi:hypothetical protein
MAYSVLNAGNIMAQHIDSLVKNAVYTAGALENGNVIVLGDLSSTSGEEEVYVASTPATASLGTDIFYMVNEPAMPLVGSTYQFKGLIDDPTEFNIAASTVFSCYKPQVGDEIILSEDGIAGTISTNTYIIPANGTTELTWASSTSTVSLAYELIDTTYIKVPGSIFYDTRITAYKFRCVKA